MNDRGITDNAARTALPAYTTGTTVITVFNQKGGIGKTTTSVNLATCLAASGFTVTLIDVDSQSNAGTSLGLVPAGARGSYHLLRGEVTLAEVAESTIFPGLSVCRADDELAGIDVELALDDEPHSVLRRSLARGGLAVDVVIIDCPPALGLLPVNALVASHLVLVPVTPEPMAHDGLQMAWRHIRRVRTGLNPGLELAGVIMTLVRDDPVHDTLAATLRREFGKRALSVEIPLDGRALEASHNDLPVTVFDPDCPSARAYLALTGLIAGQIHDLARARNPAGDGPEPPPAFDARRTGSVLADWHETAMLAGPVPTLPTPAPGWVLADGDPATPQPPLVRLSAELAGGLGLAIGALLGFGLSALAYAQGML